MIRSEKKLSEFAKLFESKNSMMVAEAVGNLREEQPFEGAVGLLAALYDRTSDADIHRAVGDFMNDLKDRSVCPEVISEINRNWKTETLTMLVSSCWQSGLDYSPYFSDLIRLFSRADYCVALECFTVIGEAVPNLSNDEKDQLTDLIIDNTKAIDEEKKLLAGELLKILS